MAECGTYGRYQQHRKNNEPVDDACAKANAAYRSFYRKTHPLSRAKQRRRAGIVQQAYRELAARHPAEFFAITERLEAQTPPAADTVSGS